MGRVLKSFLLFLVTLTSGQVWAQADSWLDVINDKVGDLQIKGTLVDVGRVVQGELVTFVFPYKVSEAGSVKILGIHQQCGCIMQSINPGQVLGAGTQGEFRIDVNTTHFQGAFDKTVTLITNESEGQYYGLKLKAFVERSLSLDPPLVEIDFSKGIPTPSVIVKISNLSKQTLHIENLRYNEDNLAVERRQTEAGWELAISWKGERPQKPWMEALEVETSGIIKSFRIPLVEAPPALQAQGAGAKVQVKR